MIEVAQHHETFVDEVLQRHLDNRNIAGRVRWAMTDEQEALGAVTARLTDGWLWLLACLPGSADGPLPDPLHWPELLRFNALLSPQLKIGLDESGRASLLGELPLSEEAEEGAAHRIETLVASFDGALAMLNTDLPASADAVREAVTGEPAETLQPLTDLARVCAEAGWSHEAHREHLAIALDVAEAYCPATLRCQPAGVVQLAFELPVERSDAPACRIATAWLLLRVCQMVRYVRAAASGTEGSSGLRLEATWNGLPEGSELGHALAAMSVACRMAYGELQAIQEQHVAERFLMVQGWSLPSDS